MSIFEKVKELREITGAGMQDCKIALSENNEDIDLAIEFLRKKGIAKAAKKSDRGASEGLITIFNKENSSSIIEINSETDFVAKNPEFNKFCEKIATLCFSSKDIEDLKDKKFNENETVASALVSLVAKIGENIQIRRFQNLNSQGSIASYIHNKQSEYSGKLGVLVAYESDNSDLSKSFANQLCMHIAASSPLALNSDGISKDFLENEKKIITDLLLNEGKKLEMIDKIVSGKISKIIKDNTLLGQKWVMNQDLSVENAIKNFQDENKTSFVIKNFIRYKVGEGLDVQKTDFADEVKSLTK